MQITTIGLDIAKNAFQVHGIDAAKELLGTVAQDDGSRLPVDAHASLTVAAQKAKVVDFGAVRAAFDPKRSSDSHFHVASFANDVAGTEGGGVEPGLYRGSWHTGRCYRPPPRRKGRIWLQGLDHVRLEAVVADAIALSKNSAAR